jgi:adenine-specific DNA-methyltransferase
MKNRLEIARQLLRDDGVIFVQCDYREQAYLKVIMDEIFGVDNFIGMVSDVVKAEGRNYGLIAQATEYILSYKKTDRVTFNEIEVDREFKYADIFGPFNIKELRNGNSAFSVENRPNLYYPIYVSSNKDENGFNYVTLDKNAAVATVYPPVFGNGVKGVWRWGRDKVGQNTEDLMAKTVNGKWQIYQKRRNNAQRMRDYVIDKECATSRGNSEIAALGLSFENPKPEKIISTIIEVSTTPGDLVLDYHLGSGTTAAVAHKMGRRWIGIEQMDYIETIAKKRLEKVIAGEQGGISKSVGWQGGGDFVYMELKKYNQDYVDRIWAAQTYGELDAIKDEMLQNAFLKFWFTKADFDAKWRDGEINARKVELINLLDANQLYLNYADMDDAKYKVSDDDKALTKRFYGPDEDGEEIRADVDIDDIIDDGDGMETSGE